MSLKDRLNSILGVEEMVAVDEPVIVTIPEEEQGIVLADGEIAVAETVVAEHEEEITEIQHDIDVLEERLEDIEENVAGLEAMMTGEAEWNPGLAMKMYKDARKLTERSFGESETITAIDGVESFADASTAGLVIVDGLEDIKEKAKAAGTAIVNFFKNLYKTVIAAFVGLFDRLKGIQSRSDAIVTRLNSTSDDKIKDEIKLGAWNAYLDVERNGSVIGKMAGISASVKEVGGALNASKGDGAMGIIVNSLNKLGSVVDGKKEKSGNADNKTSIGHIAGVEFVWTVPKVLASLRSASLSYRVTDMVKTSGEHKSSYKKSALIQLAKTIKNDAASAANDKFSASQLGTARDRAIAAVKSVASGEESRKEAQALRAAHTVSNNIARTLTRYQGDVLVAGQKFITAHL